VTQARQATQAKQSKAKQSKAKQKHSKVKKQAVIFNQSIAL
jgi:hypothetical protein